eukprot:scaffold27307_cov56-Isochrysis_galbana.AAC.1
MSRLLQQEGQIDRGRRSPGRQGGQGRVRHHHRPVLPAGHEAGASGASAFHAGFGVCGDNVEPQAVSAELPGA